MKKLKALPLATHLKISTILMASGCLIGWISAEFSTGELNIGMALGLILLFGGIIWHILFMRCPHCGRHLNPRAGLSNFCPECGEKLL